MALGLGRTGLDLGDLAQVDRLALVDADHQVGDIVGRAQELAGLHRQHLRRSRRSRGRVDHRPGRHREVGRGQRALEPQQVDAAITQPGRIERDLHHPAGAADGVDLAAAGHALELGLQRVRDALDLDRAALVLRPQRDAQHRHVVDALGSDDGRERSQPGGQPVLVRVEHVVKPHQRFGAWHANLELHRQHRDARPGDRVAVLDAGDLAQHLLGRPRHQRLHIGTAGARERDQHVGHRHVDLRLFLAWRHQHREQAQQHRHQREQRGQRMRLEAPCQAACNTHLCLGRGI